MERSDAQLVMDYREGSDAAFAALVRRNLPIVHRFALRYANVDEAEDVAQETFIRVWRKLGSFDAAKQFRPWLFEIAKNVALDRLKKRATVAFSDLGGARTEFMEGVADDAPHPSAAVDAAGAGLQLAFAMVSLPQAQRDVIRLHYDHDLTFREIAGQLGKSLNTVKSWHLRALKSLKKMKRGDE